MSTLLVRSAHDGDVGRIAEIHAHAWHAAYAEIVSEEILAGVTPGSRAAHWRRWFDEGDHEVRVLEQEGRLVGFARTCAPQAVADPPEGWGELSHLYLDPGCTGVGFGKRLFADARERLDASGRAGMLLWTLERNARARAFYERQGMRSDGALREEPGSLGPGVRELRYLLSFD